MISRFFHVFAPDFRLSLTPLPRYAFALTVSFAFAIFDVYFTISMRRRFSLSPLVDVSPVALFFATLFLCRYDAPFADDFSLLPIC